MESCLGSALRSRSEILVVFFVLFCFQFFLPHPSGEAQPALISLPSPKGFLCILCNF